MRFHLTRTPEIQESRMHPVHRLAIAGLALVSLLPAQIQIQQKAEKRAEKKAQEKLQKRPVGRAARILPMQRRKPPTQEQLVERKKEKLAGAWLKKAPWILDFDAAKAESKKSGKPIFAYFTRSYAP